MNSYVKIKVSLLKYYVRYLNRPKHLQKEVNTIIQGAESTIHLNNSVEYSEWENVENIEVYVPIDIMIEIEKEVRRLSEK